MTNAAYPEPVDRLLAYQDCMKVRRKPDYLQEFGFTQEHIPDLIRMAIDPMLNQADTDSLEIWAPLHAWRVLGQLRAEEAIDPLLSLFPTAQEDDWIAEEMPTVLGQIGPAAIPHLQTYLMDRSRDYFSRSIAATTLAKIGTTHPDRRSDCIAILLQALEHCRKNNLALNSFIISDLTDMKAVEAAPVIEKAFAADRVDLEIVGDWGNVQVEMGLKRRDEITAPPTSVQGLINYYSTTTEKPASRSVQGFGTGATGSSKKAGKKKRK